MLIARLFALVASPYLAAGEALGPDLKYTMLPVAEAYPAFANGEPPIFNTTVQFAEVAAETLWHVIRDQRTLVGSMACEIQRMNGTVGDEEMVVTWQTPENWHRWHRTDVRKYVARDDAKMVNSFFLCGGFGLWLPRLAFTEKVLSTGEGTSELNVDVWYELDEKYIGWDTGPLREKTKARWEKFYREDYQAAIYGQLFAMHEAAKMAATGGQEL
eukprot:gnl/TRDRNA2_/TRDRNA2_40818_c0_seq1.p1 gnl/TRDRNA2_/TRDRNA2_40818_c0~~gnl/TRDRNA2_/TRDRNA2_40818_c0_seq1.p1  ORF type:complete len:243 (-),score=48.72 gnl/TRDRNA2_/TRDRNA2_40818_c0_seq1:152-796(-)